MLLNSLTFSTGGQCILTLEEPNGWLRATWVGQVGPTEAMQGALTYLHQVPPLQSACLLNDNVALRGPWFDSTEWLTHAWLPQALRLGLRYIAHVVQADTHHDILTSPLLRVPPNGLHLQIFDGVPEAEEWLRGCELNGT